MTVKIYGIPKSRAFRCIWAAEEAGVPYEIVPTDFTTGVKSAAYAAINPNARVPAMQDGDLTMWESLAINLHILRKGGSLIPPGNGLSLVEMWTLWVATEIEPHQMQWAYNTVIRPPEQRDAKAGAAGAEALKARLGILEKHLEGREWLLGSTYSGADVNLACVLFSAWLNKFDFSGTPKVLAWLERCIARPGAARARALRDKS